MIDVKNVNRDKRHILVSMVSSVEDHTQIVNDRSDNIMDHSRLSLNKAISNKNQTDTKLLSTSNMRASNSKHLSLNKLNESESGMSNKPFDN